MSGVTIAIENPLNDDIRVLIAELNGVLHALTPPEHCYHLTVEQMAEPSTTVFIARENGMVVACGALKRHGNVGEVKRMYTRPAWQRRGIGGRILNEIEGLACREGLGQLVLETGDRHHAAYRAYERAGFCRCGPVLDYPDTGWSFFYSKALVPEAVAA